MKKFFLILSISTLYISVNAQSSSKEIQPISQEELSIIKKKQVVEFNQLKSLKEKYKDNPSEDLLKEIEHIEKNINDLKELEKRPVMKKEGSNTNSNSKND